MYAHPPFSRSASESRLRHPGSTRLLHEDYFLSPPFMTAMITPVQYDEKGRQIKYVESAFQRQERVAFLKKRAWARRVSTWIKQSQLGDDRHSERVVLYDSALSTSGHRPKVAWNNTISIPESPEEYIDENEPYIIYSSSSSSSGSPSSSTSALSDEATSPATRHHASRKSSPRRSPRLRRHLSLSSINEEPEED